MRIHKGDRVVVRSGKYKGHRAEVVKAMPREGKLVLDGVNVAKRHTKPARNVMQGGIIDKFMPIPASSVSLLCRSCGAPTRVGTEVDEEGQKVRVCRRCGGEL
jgi:large subunit ribosomal protein L24